MRLISIAILIFISGLIDGFAQRSLDISHLKTTSLVFPYPIVNVDRGSRDVLAQRVTGVDNTVQLKAARKDFPETNLTVITADGNVHHFYIRYAESPARHVFKIDSARIRLINGPSVKAFDDMAQHILQKKSLGRLKTRKRSDVRLSLHNIFIEADHLFFDLSIDNESNIPYDVQSLRVFIRDRKQLKRTAFQERELTPVFIANNTASINENSMHRVIVVLEKFTIPDSKIFDLELFEDNGGRHLNLHVKNKAIVNARKLAK